MSGPRPRSLSWFRPASVGVNNVLGYDQSMDILNAENGDYNFVTEFTAACCTYLKNKHQQTFTPDLPLLPFTDPQDYSLVNARAQSGVSFETDAQKRMIDVHFYVRLFKTFIDKASHLQSKFSRVEVDANTGQEVRVDVNVDKDFIKKYKNDIEGFAALLRAFLESKKILDKECGLWFKSDLAKIGQFFMERALLIFANNPKMSEIFSAIAHPNQYREIILKNEIRNDRVDMKVRNSQAILAIKMDEVGQEISAMLWSVVSRVAQHTHTF